MKTSATTINQQHLSIYLKKKFIKKASHNLYLCCRAVSQLNVNFGAINVLIVG